MMAQTAVINNEISETPTPQYISLSLDNVNLLTEQTNITSIEDTKEIDYTDSLEGSVGWLHYNNHKIPVYGINDKFEVMNSRPDERMICAVLNSNDSYISILCRQVSTFKHQIVKIEHLPECMQTPACIIDSMCLYTNNSTNNIDFIVDPESLVKYFNEYEERYI